MKRDDLHWADGDDLADLLDAERAVDPPPASSDRVFERVLASIAVAAPGPLDGPMPIDGGASALGAGEAATAAGEAALGMGEAALGASAAAGSSVTVSVGTGLSGAAIALIGGSSLGALALGTWLVLSPTGPAAPVDPGPRDAPASAVAFDQTATALTPTPAEPASTNAETPSEEPAPIVAPPIAAPAPRPVRTKKSSRLDRDWSGEPKSKPKPAVDDALRAELKLLNEARDALAEDAPARAVKALEDHARRYPRGRVVQERELLMIKALVASDRIAAARERARRFERRYPDSLHRSVLKALLPDDR